MTTEEILFGILVFIIIMVWQFHSNKLGRQLKNTVIIVVDFFAFLIFCVSKLAFDRKILCIIVLIMMSLFWIFWANRNKKDISLEDLKESHLDDLCFAIGLVVIMAFLALMQRGMEIF